MSPDIANCALGGKLPLGENHRLRGEVTVLLSCIAHILRAPHLQGKKSFVSSMGHYSLISMNKEFQIFPRPQVTGMCTQKVSKRCTESWICIFVSGTQIPLSNSGEWLGAELGVSACGLELFQSSQVSRWQC